jgi:hypothetical protein
MLQVLPLALGHMLEAAGLLHGRHGAPLQYLVQGAETTQADILLIKAAITHTGRRHLIHHISLQYLMPSASNQDHPELTSTALS